MTEFQLNAKRYSLAKVSSWTGEIVWSDYLISITDAMDILRNLPSQNTDDRDLKERMAKLYAEQMKLESDMRQSMCRARVDQVIAETIGRNR